VNNHAVRQGGRAEVPAARRRLFSACLIAGLLVHLCGSAPAGPVDGSLDALLGSVRSEHNLPALAAAVVRTEGMIAVGAGGVRRMGFNEPVTLEDRFHIGSCAKSMTATVCASLVDQGRLSWQATIGDTFPDLRDELRAEFRGVTLEQLLAHRSGLACDREPNRWLLLRLRLLTGTMPEQRRELMKIVFNGQPAAEPGSEFLYSNFGYTMAGAMAEQVSGEAWEQLLGHLLLEPLGITSAGFGAPGTPGTVDQPWGHRLVGADWVPVSPGPLADNPAVISPAGCLHLTITDWAKYAVFHLRGARGDARLLKPATFKRLHSDAYAQGYALGWGLRDQPSLGGTVLTHAGSNGAWFALIRIAPQADLAVLIATNAGGDAALKACRAAADSMVNVFSPPQQLTGGAPARSGDR